MNALPQSSDALTSKLGKELVSRELARRNLSDFVLYTYPQYLMGKVHALVCEKLQQFYIDVKNKKSPRLIITFPPRHGKSELVSRRFPAWCFGKNPNLTMINCSYSADLAGSFNRSVQDIIDSQVYKNIFPNTKIPGRTDRTSGKERNAEKFQLIDADGVYRSAGVRGGITGMGADILSIDDPVKDRAEAASLTIREGIYDWFRSTAYTRLAPGGGVLLTMTRWHLDDLVGRLLDEQLKDEYGVGDKWEIINFPAIATEDEYIYKKDAEKQLFRKKDEPLHPERFDLASLNRIKHVLGTFEFLSLYQQNPVAEGGNIFRKEWFRYYNYDNLPKQFDKLLFSWDMSFKGNANNDYVAGVLFGVKGVNYYLIDLVKKRMGFTDTIKEVEKLYHKYPTVTTCLIEDKANGTAIIDVLGGKIPGVIGITPQESKIARAQAISSLFEAGNVYLPSQQMYNWVDQLEAELMSFPSSKHDDQVDCISQALNWLKKSNLNQWERLARRTNEFYFA